MKKIDDLDRRILTALHNDPQASNKEIAEQLDISQATVGVRIDRMISERIMKITVQRDIRMGAYPVLSVIHIQTRGRDAVLVARELSECQFVIASGLFADDPQIFINVMARDTNHLSEIVERFIAPVPGVERAEITICLDPMHLKPGIAAL